MLWRGLSGCRVPRTFVFGIIEAVTDQLGLLPLGSVAFGGLHCSQLPLAGLVAVAWRLAPFLPQPFGGLCSLGCLWSLWVPLPAWLALAALTGSAAGVMMGLGWGGVVAVVMAED